MTLRRCESIRPERAERMVVTHNPNVSLGKGARRDEVPLDIWKNTALLYTCRTVYNEGLSIFCSQNKLHFPALAQGLMLNKRQQVSFSLLTSVSFDYPYKQLLSSVENSRSPRCLICRLRPSCGFGSAQQVQIYRAALSTLAARLDTMTIICPREKMSTLSTDDPALDFSEFALLNSIAPWAQWGLYT